MTTLLPKGALDTVLARASDPAEFERWTEQIRRTGFCSHPIRLRGQSLTIDAGSGEILRRHDSSEDPDGVLLIACRNRRATRCPSCSDTYRQDSFHLIAAGLRGGKGIPDTVARHPRTFVTLTAPSFGPVHSRRDGQQACRPRPSRDRCQHGLARGCWKRHRDGDPLLGQPICPECFDYDEAVLWNAVAPELWRRTTIAIRRELARLANIPVRKLNDHIRLRFTKVIEYQARGAVHVHALLRLDGPDPDDVVAASDEWTAELLQQAIRSAVAKVRTPIAGLADGGNHRVGWGEQLDVHPLAPPGEGADAQSELRRIAAYVAKYATKSTDHGGALDRRLQHATDIDQLAIDEHHREFVEAAWRLGAEPHLASLKLRRWAHTLGYRGHWSTRSRRYSTTLTSLRAARREWFSPSTPRVSPAAELTVGRWTYAGSGFRTLGDSWLAATAQSQRLEAARERRQTLRIGPSTCP